MRKKLMESRSCYRPHPPIGCGRGPISILLSSWTEGSPPMLLAVSPPPHGVSTYPGSFVFILVQLNTCDVVCIYVVHMGNRKKEMNFIETRDSYKKLWQKIMLTQNTISLSIWSVYIPSVYSVYSDDGCQCFGINVLGLARKWRVPLGGVASVWCMLGGIVFVILLCFLLLRC